MATPNNQESKGRGDFIARAKRFPCKLVWAGITLGVLVGAFLALRIAVRVWMHESLPADAPRIAFSLDNTLLAQAGTRASVARRLNWECDHAHG